MESETRVKKRPIDDKHDKTDDKKPKVEVIEQPVNPKPSTDTVDPSFTGALLVALLQNLIKLQLR